MSSDDWKTAREAAKYGVKAWGAKSGAAAGAQIGATVAAPALAIPVAGPAIFGLATVGAAIAGGILGWELPGAAITMNRSGG
jgi:hypothetical protein